MTNQPDAQLAGTSREARTNMIRNGALDTLKGSLDAFLLSIRAQEQSVVAMRQLNARGLHSTQEAQAMESAVKELIVSQLMRDATKDNADDGLGVRD